MFYKCKTYLAFFLVVVEKLSRANWQVSNPNWTKSAFLLSAQMWEPYPVVMSAHEHKMHRAMQILLLCRHSGPCEHKLPPALLILSLLSTTEEGCIAHEHMQTPTQFSSSQFTTTTEKTYKQLTLSFLPPPFSPVLVSLLQNPYTFGGRCWPSKHGWLRSTQASRIN